MGANKDFNIEGKNVPQEEKERQIEQGQNKDPYNVTDMRKLWKYKKLEDGTLRITDYKGCLLYTSPSPRDQALSRMPSSA